MEEIETKKIIEEQKLLTEVTNHQGWVIVRRILTDKILGLQNVFDIDASSPDIMFRDLQARKKASEILFDFLREIEGAKDVVQSQVTRETFIVKLD